ncbi:MAG: toprim domain-containing protein, partial [Anaerolinea sp.]|nr:toprim domain-containing protein [Anaerolinea sp.]
MTEAIRAYCVKCRTQREIENVQAEWLKNGRPAVRGTCSVCGTAVLRMGLTLAHEGVPKLEEKVRTNGTGNVKSDSTTKTKSPASAKRSVKTTKAVSRAQSAKKARSPKSNSTKVSSKKLAGQTRSKTRQTSGSPIGNLVIVESPAKARSVGNFLGRGYTVKASKGHVRDLLVSRLSVDVENNFQPEYRVMNDKRAIVKELAEDAARATSIFLATDPDREGEAIAWHLIAAASMEDLPVQRVVFHEITEQAIKEAFAHPRG